MVHRLVSVVRPSTIFKELLQNTGPIEAKFHMEPQWDGGIKVYLRGLGLMAKIAAMSIYGKNPSKNVLLQNQRANDLVAWYVALGPWAHHKLFK